MKLLIKNWEKQNGNYVLRNCLVNISPKDFAQKVSDAINGDKRLGKDNKEVYRLGDLMDEIGESVGCGLLKAEGCVSPDITM